MKLRNKRTGEIVIANVTRVVSGVDFDCGQTLAELNEEWQDYEEPKEHWTIGHDGAIFKLSEWENQKDHEEIGNYFETEEEAEKARDKLKAWHKLIGYWETEILGWEIRDMPTGGNWQTVNVKFNIKARKEPMELLDLLFGGGE